MPSGLRVKSASTKRSGRIQAGQYRYTVKPEHYPEKLVCFLIAGLLFGAVLFASSLVSGFGVNSDGSLELQIQMCRLKKWNYDRGKSLRLYKQN